MQCVISGDLRFSQLLCYGKTFAEEIVAYGKTKVSSCNLFLRLRFLLKTIFLYLILLKVACRYAYYYSNGTNLQKIPKSVTNYFEDNVKELKEAN